MINRRKFIKKLGLGAALSLLPNSTAIASMQQFGFRAPVIFSTPLLKKTRYVSKKGDDGNDGLSWQSAKLTVRAAVESLPEEGFSVQRRKSGDIYIDEGEFIEEDNGVDPNQNYLIECSANIRFHGMGCPVSGNGSGGTVLKLGDNVNRHFFGPRSSFSDWAHSVSFENILLDGNRENNLGNYDIIRLRRPAFNTNFRNLQFRNAAGWAIKVLDNAVNFYAYNLSGSNNTGFFNLVTEKAANTTNIGFWGVQIDNCGIYPFQIDAHQSGTGNFFINGLEAESYIFDQHKAIIRYVPHEGENGLYLTFDNLFAWNNQEQINNSIILIDSGSGSGCWTTYRNLINDGFDFVYQDLRLGINSTEREFAIFGRNEFAEMQLGTIKLLTGNSGPENQISASQGSIYAKNNGELWVKQEGKDNTGWKKVMMEL